MHTGRKGRHHKATGDCRRKGSVAVGLLATLAEALKESESLPELILKDSYKHTVGVRPGQILAERTTATPEQKARSLDGKAWAQTEAKGQRSQVDQGSESGHSRREGHHLELAQRERYEGRETILFTGITLVSDFCALLWL